MGRQDRPLGWGMPQTSTPDDSETRMATSPALGESPGVQPRLERDSSLSALLLAGLALLALLPRVVNLGSFSMWFDEVVEAQQASGSLARTWAELKSDVVHPPMEGLLTWSLLHLGIDETARRWFPIAFGVVSILLLASWAARRFGRIAGVATGVFAAAAPIHVHYSQELRPYALAMLWVALAVVAADRLLARVDGLHLVLAALAILGCLYSLYFAGLVLAFVGWLILDTAVIGQPEEAARARRVLAWSPVLLLGLGLAYLPWISTVLAMGHQRIQRAANNWTWENISERWQALTVGTGTSASGWGSVVALLLVLLGIACAVRTAAGRAVLVAALCGTVGIDLLLLYADHWSSDRYNFDRLALPGGAGRDGGGSPGAPPGRSSRDCGRPPPSGLRPSARHRPRPPPPPGLAAHRGSGGRALATRRAGPGAQSVDPHSSPVLPARAGFPGRGGPVLRGWIPSPAGPALARGPLCAPRAQESRADRPGGPAHAGRRRARLVSGQRRGTPAPPHSTVSRAIVSHARPRTLPGACDAAGADSPLQARAAA